MRGLVTVVAAMLVFAAPAGAATIYTVAGNGALGPLGDGAPATAAALGNAIDIAAAADGGYLLIDGPRVRRVGPDGRISTVAGTGRSGFSGDGGPATAARIRPSGIAAEPDGGFLIAECSNNRVRRVAPDGVITTVAGSTKPAANPAFNFGGDGGPATAAKLACPVDVAVQNDGGFVIADSENYRLRRVSPDGVISTLAGTRKDYDDNSGTPGDGGPSTAADVQPDRLAIAADGALLFVDRLGGVIRRIGLDGVISTVAGTREQPRPLRDGAVATKVAVDPDTVAAMPDGGFLIGNVADESCAGGTPAVLRVSPEGRITHLVGSGRFIPDPPQGDERAGDGGSALQVDLRGIGGLAVAPDGGLLVVDSHVNCSSARIASLVRYVAPEAPTVFAASLVDAQKRVLAPGSSTEVSVALTLPATVTLTAGSVTSVPQQQPAGMSSIPLPAPMGAKPMTVTLTATDASGVEARDTLELFPSGWLTLARASIDADKLAFRVPALRGGFTGSSPVLGCRRFGPARVDCRMTENRKRCDGVIALMLRRGKLWWGDYRCPVRKKPAWRTRPRLLMRRDVSCDIDDPSWCTAHPFAGPFAWGPDHVIAYKGTGL